VQTEKNFGHAQLDAGGGNRKSEIRKIENQNFKFAKIKIRDFSILRKGKRKYNDYLGRALRAPELFRAIQSL
jgi:hypothetical protein